MQLGKIREVLLTSDASAKNFNVGVWDISCGTLINTYKGNPCSPRAFVLHGDQLFTASPSRTYVTVLPLKGSNRQSQRLDSDATITAIALSTRCYFLAIAMEEKVQMWELNTGWESRLLTGHYQKVSNMVFSKNDRYLITGGNDGLILVWDVVKILSDDNDDMKPTYTLTFHSLALTCLWVAPLSNWNFLLSSSLDQTGRVVNLLNGKNECNFDFPSSVHCICGSKNMVNIFCGLGDGKIYGIQRNDLTNFSSDVGNESAKIFHGHSLAVTCVQLSIDGTVLASGSDDHSVRIWDVQSKETLHILKHLGAITNLCFTIQSTDIPSDEAIFIPFVKRGSLPDGRAKACVPSYKEYSIASLEDFGADDKVQDDVMELKYKVEKLIQTNKELFEFAVMAKFHNSDGS